MSDYREESEKAKQKRRGIIDQRPVTSNKKKSKPYELWVTWSFLSLRLSDKKPRRWGSYATLRGATDALKHANETKYYTDNFIKGPNNEIYYLDDSGVLTERVYVPEST
jgi:hypothetical protein